MNEMNITSAQYRNGIGGSPIGIVATIDNVEMTVPIDTNNRHYQAILEWVAEGNTITPAS